MGIAHNCNKEPVEPPKKEDPKDLKKSAELKPI
jgi:hypothetical protein